MPDNSGIFRKHAKYQFNETDSHLGEYGRPKISDEKKEMIIIIFNDKPTVSTSTAATQIGVHHSTICNFLSRDLKLYP